MEKAREKSRTNIKSTEDPAIRVDSRIVDKAIKYMKTGKAPEPSGFTDEMLKTCGRV